VKRLLIDVLCLVLLALVLHGCLSAAPAPDLVRRPKPAGKLTRTSLVGTWTVQWGTVSSTFILSPSGDYACFWPGGKYVGSWGVGRDGRLWITESCRPDSASSWQSYAIRLTPEPFTSHRCPTAFTGPVEVGATGVVVRLVKQR
jgi:hypothetical protein